MFTVISWNGTPEEEQANRRLRLSANDFGLDCRIGSGDWPGLPKYLLRMLEECPEDILWVQPGGIIRRKPVALLKADKPDMAAHVAAVPPREAKAGRFQGIGRIGMQTMFFRQSDTAKSILVRWIEANTARPDREPQDNLLYFLAEEDIRFLYLPHEYIWNEKEHRSFFPGAMPIVEYGSMWSAPQVFAPKAPEPSRQKFPEVIWSGHMYDYSGYGRSNREILFRVANTMRVRLSLEGIIREPTIVDSHTKTRLDLHKGTIVSLRAPFLRFYGPLEEPRKENTRKICFTMMETETAHPGFIDTLNRNYDEVWVPTLWNEVVFRSGGLRLPCLSMPLGVNPLLFRPIQGVERPAALRIAGGPPVTEQPRGFAFVSVFQPTFRKGIDFMVEAFEKAFGGDPDVSLTFVTSVHRQLVVYGCDPFSAVGGPDRVRSNIYHLVGCWSDDEMARIYSSFDAYITTSRGEGWNLPAAEADACGLPVIASLCSSHPQALGKRARYFRVDGFGPYPGSGGICRWYEGQKFAKLGPKALDECVDLLREIRGLGGCYRFQRSQRNQPEYTWDKAAERVATRLMEVQG